MDDRTLESLLRNTEELAEFERDLGLGAPVTHESPLLILHAAAGSVGRPIGQQSQSRRNNFAWAGPLVGLTGIAAAIAIALVTVRPLRNDVSRQIAQAPAFVPPGGQDGSDAPLGVGEPNRGPPQGPRVEIVRPIDPTRATDETQNMVLAMYEGTDPKTGLACDNCECVQWWSHDWGTGRDVADIRPGELIGASMEHSCMSAPTRVVVVGLTGPASALPESDVQARELVNCIMGRESAHACTDRDATVATAASYCLPSGVAVRVQTWNR